MKIKIILSLALLATVAHADIFGTGANQFSIDFVNIGHVGNVADASGYGAVNYDYRIGTYETTIGQFTKAVAADSRISHGYRSENYWNDGIRTVGINAPATDVSWSESAMFCNWLTTGDAYMGAYQFDGVGTYLGTDRPTAVAAYGTVYVIPSEDEWYKAAYYKPVNDGSYSLYASGLDTTPVKGTVNGWNYRDSEGRLNPPPDYTWETGVGAEEQNGTHDIMGNVGEWNEALFLPGEEFPGRTFRGGGYNSTEVNLGSSSRDGELMSYEVSYVGLRIAAIPEPSSVLLLTIGSGGLLFYRRAKRLQRKNRPPSRRLFS